MMTLVLMGEFIILQKAPRPGRAITRKQHQEQLPLRRKIQSTLIV